MTERLPNKQQMTGEEVGRRKSEKGVEEAQRRRNVGGVVKQNMCSKSSPTLTESSNL